jgi:hypothetical protein
VVSRLFCGLKLKNCSAGSTSRITLVTTLTQFELPHPSLSEKYMYPNTFSATATASHTIVVRMSRTAQEVEP